MPPEQAILDRLETKVDQLTVTLFDQKTTLVRVDSNVDRITDRIGAQQREHEAAIETVKGDLTRIERDLKAEIGRESSERKEGLGDVRKFISRIGWLLATSVASTSGGIIAYLVTRTH